MGHGLGSDIGSDLSSAPPSPRLPPSPSPPPAPRLAPSLPPPSLPQPTRDRSLSSATEPPWKTRPRPKRQPSTSVPNPPSSPKRRKRTESGKEKNTEKGKDTEKGKEPAGKGKGTGSTRGKGGAKAVGKIQVPVKAKDPPPEEEVPTEEKASTSKVAPAPWKKVKVSPPPAPLPVTKPPPFAKSKITSKPPFNTSKSTSPDPSKAIKPAPSSAVKPTRTTKRPVYNESADSSDEEEEQEKPKRHKRRKSHVEATPRASRKPRPSLPAQPTPKAKPKPDPSPLELRPASFLTKTSSFLTKAIVPPTNLSLQPREDVWSYDDLTGLAWVKLDVHKCEVVPGNEKAGVLGEQCCWWPAEVKQNTSNGIKLGLCGIGIERELTPHAADETNVLTLRKPNCSSVRFPTFKTAFSAPSRDFEAPPRFGEPPTGETSSQPSGEPSTEPSTQPAAKSSTPPNESSILPTSPSALETTWKQALSCAFKIDADSNDGLEDIFLLFSQKSNPREEDEMSANTALDEHEEEEPEEDILENGTTVLCRYRTRYYPAQIISYHPREGKTKSRRGHKGRYKCVFADESTRLATRFEIMTTLDEGFATCPLGTYRRYTSGTHEKPSGVREPSPAPRAHSPAPEHEDCKIDPEEYCSRERMRDQLKPVLPFLKGLIERTYIPGKGVVEGGHSTKPKADDSPPAQEHDASEPEPVLDRHAIFMQGGRARKNLAYSVHTGDLNEDDCEELMFEISRWALRGERWACEEGAGQEYGGEGMSQQSNEGVGGTSQESGEGEGASQEVQEGGRSQTDLETKVTGDSSSLQPAQESEPIVEGTKTLDNAEDVEMEDASQKAHEGGVSEAKSGDTTELEDALMVVKILEPTTPSTYGDFRSLIKLQPPRPTGAPDYEGLTPEERMGYVSDVLYPEAAALILSYRRGIRTQPGPLSDPTAERALYTAGQQAAKNTSSASDWVEQILAIRQLRAANSKYHVEEQAQVVVAGGTKSRPKYMTSVFK